MHSSVRSAASPTSWRSSCCGCAADPYAMTGCARLRDGLDAELRVAEEGLDLALHEEGRFGEDVVPGRVLLRELDRTVQLGDRPTASGKRKQVDAHERRPDRTRGLQRDRRGVAREVLDLTPHRAEGDVRPPLVRGRDAVDRS